MITLFQLQTRIDELQQLKALLEAADVKRQKGFSKATMTITAAAAGITALGTIAALSSAIYYGLKVDFESSTADTDPNEKKRTLAATLMWAGGAVSCVLCCLRSCMVPKRDTTAYGLKTLNQLDFSDQAAIQNILKILQTDNLLAGTPFAVPNNTVVDLTYSVSALTLVLETVIKGYQEIETKMIANSAFTNSYNSTVTLPDLTVLQSKVPVDEGAPLLPPRRTGGGGGGGQSLTGVDGTFCCDSGGGGCSF